MATTRTPVPARSFSTSSPQATGACTLTRPSSAMAAFRASLGISPSVRTGSTGSAAPKMRTVVVRLRTGWVSSSLANWIPLGHKLPFTVI